MKRRNNLNWCTIKGLLEYMIILGTLSCIIQNNSGWFIIPFVNLELNNGLILNCLTRFFFTKLFWVYIEKIMKKKKISIKVPKIFLVVHLFSLQGSRVWILITGELVIGLCYKLNFLRHLWLNGFFIHN